MGYTVFKMPSGPQYSTLAALGTLHFQAFMQASYISRSHCLTIIIILTEVEEHVTTGGGGGGGGGG